MQNEVELTTLFREYAPEVDYEIFTQRSFMESIPPSVLITSEILLTSFPLIWKVLTTWLERYANGKVSIKYKTDKGEEITVEYSKLTQKEVDQFLKTWQSDLTASADSPVKLNFTK